jgi:hypothetical protein
MKPRLCQSSRRLARAERHKRDRITFYSRARNAYRRQSISNDRRMGKGVVTQHANSPIPPAAPVTTTVINQPVIERIIERALPVAITGVTGYDKRATPAVNLGLSRVQFLLIKRRNEASYQVKVVLTRSISTWSVPSFSARASLVFCWAIKKWAACSSNRCCSSMPFPAYRAVGNPHRAFLIRPRFVQ